jgi:hypothetical protein
MIAVYGSGGALQNKTKQNKTKQNKTKQNNSILIFITKQNYYNIKLSEAARKSTNPIRNVQLSETERNHISPMQYYKFL